MGTPLFPIESRPVQMRVGYRKKKYKTLQLHSGIRITLKPDSNLSKERQFHCLMRRKTRLRIEKGSQPYGVFGRTTGRHRNPNIYSRDTEREFF